MGLFLTLLSLVLAFFSPGEIAPSLARYHLQEMIMFPATAFSLISIALRPSNLSTTHCLLVLGFFGGVVMSTLSKFWFGPTFHFALQFAPVACVFFLVHMNAFSVGRIKLMCGMISVSALIMAILGILAYHTGYLQDQLVLADAGRVRGFGFLSDPNDLAQFFLVGLALLGAFYKRGSFRNVFLLPPAFVLIYGIYLTFSRGAIFGLAAILAVVSYRKGNRLLTIFGVVLLVVILLALQFGGGRQISMSEGSAAGRIMAWGAGISMLRGNPVFGVGYTEFTEYNELTAHNSFVLCFAELGLFGYFFFLALVVVSTVGLQQLSGLQESKPDDLEFGATLRALRAAFYAFLVTAWFLSRTYSITLYVLLGLVAAIIRMRQTQFPSIEFPMRRWVPLVLVTEVASVVLIYLTVRIRAL